MAWKTRVAMPLPMLGAAACVTLGAIGGIVYDLQQVRDVQAELLDVRTTLEHVKTRAGAAAVETPKAASGRAVSPDDLDGLRGELAQVRGELAQVRGELAQVREERRTAPGGAPEALVAVVSPEANPAEAPAALAAQAAPADGQMRHLLTALESQDQTLLKGVVGEILDQRQAEEREARRKRQAQELLKDLAKTLALTPTQQQQVGAILDQRAKTIDGLRAQANDQNRQDIRKRVEATRREGDLQIASLLTAEQATKYQGWSRKHPDGR